MSRVAAIEIKEGTLVGLGMSDKSAPHFEQSAHRVLSQEEINSLLSYCEPVEPPRPPLTWERFNCFMRVLEMVTCLMIIAGVLRHWG